MKPRRLTPGYKLRRLAKDPRSWGEPVKAISFKEAAIYEILDGVPPKNVYVVEDPDAFLARVHADIARVLEVCK